MIETLTKLFVAKYILKTLETCQLLYDILLFKPGGVFPPVCLNKSASGINTYFFLYSVQKNEHLLNICVSELHRSVL